MALEARSSFSLDPRVINASNPVEGRWWEGTDPVRLPERLVSHSLLQEETSPDEDDFDEMEGLADESDKTGTNPINFQRDIRLYNEFSWLNTAGDGESNVTTLEFRQPFADGHWQFRARPLQRYQRRFE